MSQIQYLSNVQEIRLISLKNKVLNRYKTIISSLYDLEISLEKEMPPLQSKHVIKYIDTCVAERRLDSNYLESLLVDGLKAQIATFGKSEELAAIFDKIRASIETIFPKLGFDVILSSKQNFNHEEIEESKESSYGLGHLNQISIFQTENNQSIPALELTKFEPDFNFVEPRITLNCQALELTMNFSEDNNGLILQSVDDMEPSQKSYNLLEAWENLQSQDHSSVVKLLSFLETFKEMIFNPPP